MYYPLHKLHTRHRHNIHHSCHIYTILEIIHLTWKLTGSVKPQPVVPLAVLFTGNLPVLGGGVEADMPQVLLQQPQPVARVIYLHGMNTEGIPQAVRTDTPYPPGFRISQGLQTSSPGTIPDNLPCPMSVEVEK